LGFRKLDEAVVSDYGGTLLCGDAKAIRRRTVHGAIERLAAYPIVN